MKDLARIYIKAGDGGSGKLSFRHEKYAPKGGPDGGDGGKGGDVILLADENVENLVEFNFTKRYMAENGEGGMSKRMHGKDRSNIVVRVPVGTAIYEISKDYYQTNLRKRDVFDDLIKSRKLLVDMDKHGKEFVGAWGGNGGRGNWHFRSSTNQTPQEFEPGRAGEEKYLLLELKVVADVGIIGLPNVGKSSLLKALTRANPRIAGYPFTTLEPQLGVMNLNTQLKTTNQLNSNFKNKNSLILVDVPGVVEEAWEGKGIGPWFLRHLERTQLLIHVLAPNETVISDQLAVIRNLINDYKVVRKELEKYGNGLMDKPEFVLINKMELVDEIERKKIGKEVEDKIGKKVVWISAASGKVDGIFG